MRMKNRLRSTKAFTLLELAVVIVIITLLTAGGVAMLMSAMSRKSYSDTQEEINDVQKIIGDYFVAHGYIPCPADITKGEGAAGFGNGVGTGAVGAAACTAANWTTGNVVAGGLPTWQLRMEDRYGSDAFGNKLIYVAYAPATVAGASAAFPPGTSITDGIRFKYDSGDVTAGSYVFAVISLAESGGGIPRSGGSKGRGTGNSDVDAQLACKCNPDGSLAGSYDATLWPMKSEETGNVQNMGNGASTNYTVMTQPERFDSLFGSIALSGLTSTSGTSSTSGGSSASGSSGGSSTGSSTGSTASSTGSTTGSSTGSGSSGSSGSSGGSSAGSSGVSSTGGSGGSSGIGGGSCCNLSSQVCATISGMSSQGSECDTCWNGTQVTLTWDGSEWAGTMVGNGSALGCPSGDVTHVSMQNCVRGLYTFCGFDSLGAGACNATATPDGCSPFSVTFANGDPAASGYCLMAGGGNSGEVTVTDGACASSTGSSSSASSCGGSSTTSSTSGGATGTSSSSGSSNSSGGSSGCTQAGQQDQACDPCGCDADFFCDCMNGVCRYEYDVCRGAFPNRCDPTACAAAFGGTGTCGGNVCTGADTNLSGSPTGEINCFDAVIFYSSQYSNGAPACTSSSGG